MGLEPIAVEKLDFGPCKATFGTATPIYLGRTQGETTIQYEVDTFALETEEDGQVDEIVTNDALTVTIPLVYTDKASLANIIPWASIVTAADSSTKLVVGKAIGKRLSDYSDKLVIHPVNLTDDDLTKDVTIHKCYPKPGPINFGYARNGQRIANITFVALEDANGEYFTIGDPTIQEGE